MKRSLVLFVSILFVLLSLVVSCASSKVEKTENVEKVEEIVTIEEPEKEDSPKAELIDGFLYVNGHRIDIYLDGGTLEGDIESILSTANKTGFITIPKVKKDGYLFLSWLDLDKGSIEERGTIELSSIDKDMKYKAEFSLDTSAINVSFLEDGNDAVIVASHPTFNITVKAPLNCKTSLSIPEVLSNAEESKIIEIPEIEMDNYVFLGWKEEGSDKLSNKVEIDLNNLKGSVSYSATFVPDLSKAVFDMGVDGDNAWFMGSLLGLSIKVSAPSNSTYSSNKDTIINNAISSSYLTLPSLERMGYDFVGWRERGEENVEKDVSIDLFSLTHSLEYEAVFEKKVYSITYDEIGIEYEEKKEPVVEPSPIVEPELPIIPESNEEEIKNPESYTIEDSFTFINPVREGYTFVGWILDGEESWKARYIEEIKEGTIGDKKYIAVWSPKTYKIQLNLDGGSITNAPSSFVYNSPSFTLMVPEKKDYDFVGWQEGDNEPKDEYVVDTTKAKDINLKAIWTPVEYKIEYNNNIVLYSPKPEPAPEPEVIPENPKSYTALDSITLINPVLDGYTFKGWIEDGEESYEAKSVYSISRGSSGDKKLSAVWIPNVYYLSYDFNGGKVAGNEPLTFTFNSDSPSFIQPERENYVFQGWVTGEEEDPFFVLDTSIPGNKVLKAIWKPLEFSLNYDLDGGEFAESYVSSYSVESPSFTTTNPIRNGYEFIGWITKENETNTLFSLSLVKDSVRTNLNAYSDHLEIYTSLFDKKTKSLLSAQMKKIGVSGVMENGVLSISYGEKENEEILSLVSSILKDTGINVDGTYYGSKAIVPYYTVDKGSTGDISLKAVWKVITYTIDYDEDGVIFGSDLNRKAENACWYTVESAFQVINPEKKGYDFVGWILEGEPTSKARSIYEFSKGTTGDKNLVAVWKPKEYSVKIDTKGGKIEEYPSTYSYLDGEYIIPTPVKNNYEFIGWRKNGDNTSLYSTYKIKSGDMGDVSLVAEWKAKEYSIEYDLGGGTLNKGVENPKTYTVLSGDFILSNPTRYGYTFLGWTENPYATYRTYSLRYTVFANKGRDIKLTALWAPIEYSITYSLDGGSYRFDNSNPAKYTIETDGVYLANPVKDGYTFLGWIMGGDRTETLRKGLVLPSGSTGNVKFYAIWEKNTVGIGEATKKQIEQMVYGKDDIPRPDWVVKLPVEEGYHYEKAYSVKEDLFEALNEAVEEGRKLIAQWAGTTFDRSDRNLDGSSYLTSGVEYSNRVRKAELVEYWQDKEGRTWVLLRVSEDDVEVN